MNVDDFDFHLPEELIAQTPLAERTASRLLTLNKYTGEIGHHQFPDLLEFLKPGDVMVLNDTKVIPARLYGVKADTGAKAEVLLLKALDNDRWTALVRPAKRLKAGVRINFGISEEGGPPMLSAVVEAEGEMGQRTLRFAYQGIFNEILDRLGTMPLPPYIKRQLEDRERYQTVYAKQQGSAAAPTAGLHFTKDLLRRIEEKGVRVVYITLHVGLGTFRPVSADLIEEHRMHSEYYEIPPETAEAVNQAKAGGGRVIAIGTTSTRTLETAGAAARSRCEGTAPPETGGMIKASSGWTDIFIYPGYAFQVVDALLTNFHLPKSTLIMLVSALAGRDRVLRAYKEAVCERYRFFSFGDAMFIYG